MSDERKKTEDEESRVGGMKSGEDVEAHSRVPGSRVPGSRVPGVTDEGSDDDDGDVEAHIRVKQ